MPFVTAVPVSCPPAENPAHYTHNFDYGSIAYGQPRRGGGGGGAGAAIASGLGGLAAGTFLGNLIGRNHAQESRMPQFGGGYQCEYDAVVDSGGGFDIAGDSGGGDDRGGGYDIAGDSGNGGFDIAGDSGD